MKALAILLTIFIALTGLLGYEWLQADARADAIRASFEVREATHSTLVDSLETVIAQRDTAIVAARADVAQMVQQADSVQPEVEATATVIIQRADTVTARLFEQYRAAVAKQLGLLRGAIARADSALALMARNEATLRVELGAERALRLEAQAMAEAEARARRPGVVGWVTRGLALYGGVRLAQSVLGGGT